MVIKHGPCATLVVTG